jgi:2'-hydroxyisoflavone reductase
LAVVMQTLVLGGTAWLGGHIASAALERGHQVTCLARGFSGAVPEGVELVRADRSRHAAYDALKQQWDVVVDVARQPGQVRSAVRALADRAGVYVFVSSGNVYADHRTPGADEDAPLLPPLTVEVMESMDTYGEAKVACEQHVHQAFEPDRALIARAGLIGGPGDIFDRTGYWPLRFARPSTPSGAVLVPDAPELARYPRACRWRQPEVATEL